MGLLCQLLIYRCNDVCAIYRLEYDGNCLTYMHCDSISKLLAVFCYFLHNIVVTLITRFLLFYLILLFTVIRFS